MPTKKTYAYQSQKQKARSLYNAWKQIKRVCTDPKHANYKNYGAIGIGVSKEWLNSFNTFLEDMGPKPTPNHVMDRKDKTGDFCKENCRWSLKVDQMRNYSRSVRLNIQGLTDSNGNPIDALDADGKPITLMAVCEKIGFNATTVRSRIQKFGYSDKKAITQIPIMHYTYLGVRRPLSEWEKILGMSAQVLHGRIEKCGWSIEKAFTTPVINRSKFITYQGKTQSILMWANELGITYSCLYQRLFIKNKSLSEALVNSKTTS